jgi:hypothetical protein
MRPPKKGSRFERSRPFTDVVLQVLMIKAGFLFLISIPLHETYANLRMLFISQFCDAGSTLGKSPRIQSRHLPGRGFGPSWPYFLLSFLSSAEHLSIYHLKSSIQSGSK